MFDDVTSGKFVNSPVSFARLVNEYEASSQFTGAIDIFASTIGTKYYKSRAVFDPATSKIYFHFNLKPQINADKSWDGRIIEIPSEGPSGVFDIVTEAGHTALVVISRTGSKAQNPNLAWYQTTLTTHIIDWEEVV